MSNWHDLLRAKLSEQPPVEEPFGGFGGTPPGRIQEIDFQQKRDFCEPPKPPKAKTGSSQSGLSDVEFVTQVNQTEGTFGGFGGVTISSSSDPFGGFGGNKKLGFSEKSSFQKHPGGSPPKPPKGTLGDEPCPTCGSGSFWRSDAGGWQCEGCTPPGDAHVRTWRSVAGGRAPRVPPAVEPWPADLDAMLRRVATAFEWSTTDRSDFIAWARRSPDGVADARVFLQSECDALDVAVGECCSRPSGNLVPIFGHAGFTAPEKSGVKSIYRRARDGL